MSKSKERAKGVSLLGVKIHELQEETVRLSQIVYSNSQMIGNLLLAISVLKKKGYINDEEIKEAYKLAKRQNESQSEIDTAINAVQSKKARNNASDGGSTKLRILSSSSDGSDKK